MGEADLIMRDYLTSKERFADLFNGVLFEGKQVVRPEQLQDADTIYRIENIGAKHTQRTRDVKMKMDTGIVLRMLAVENQNHVDYAMPFRCMEYDVAEYRKQLQSLKRQNRLLARQQKPLKFWNNAAERLCGVRKEDRLSPVYTICLYHGESPWDGPVNLHDMMEFGKDTDDMRQFFTDYPMRLYCVNEQRDFAYFHTELRELFLALQCRNDKENLKCLMNQNEACRALSSETVEAMSVLLKMPKLWENRMNYVHKTEDKEEFDMCKAMRELLEEERKNGLSQGIVQGVTQGRSSGKVEGAKNKTMTVIQNMLERGFSDEDICTIAECDRNMIDEVRGRFK